jgi:hypothetical protein
MLQEDRENMLGKINVAGCMSKQTTTFMDILIYKWNLPLSVNMWDECQSQYLVCNLYGIACEIPTPYGVHAKYFHLIIHLKILTNTYGYSKCGSQLYLEGGSNEC